MQRLEAWRTMTLSGGVLHDGPQARGAGHVEVREHKMTFVRRAGTVVATVMLTVGLIGAGPADAGRDTSWGGARIAHWGR